MSILIIDDNYMDRNHLNNTISSFTNEEILQCSSVNDALEAIKKHTFSLIFTDLDMPGFDGITFITLIKKDFNINNIIVVTSYADEHTESLCINAGIKTIIHKPIRIDDIKEALGIE